MSCALALSNRRRHWPVDLRLLRRIANHLLATVFPGQSGELTISLLGNRAMARINEQFLQHAGSTDVITFDYRESPGDATVQGEIFICLDQAAELARQFRTTWESEVVRYLAHGLLHLHGHDDHDPARRRVMKKEENRLVKQATALFPVSELGRGRKRKTIKA